MARLVIQTILLNLIARVPLVISQAAPQCPAPISLPIRNVTTKDGTERRGIEASIGTPPQKLVFLAKEYELHPSSTLLLNVTRRSLDNLTYLQDTLTICVDNSGSTSCEAANGGLLDAAKSSTWTVANESITQSRPAYDGGDTPNGQYALDTLRLGSNRTFENFYLGLTSRDWPNIAASTFGLNKNSSILFDLYNNGSIASHSWSYFFGKDGDTQVDGSLTLGGYDSAIVAPGPNLTLPFMENKDCPTKHQAIVSGLALKWKNGTSTSLLDDTSYKKGLSVCITTTYEYLAELPAELIDSFLSRSGTKQEWNSYSPLSWNELIVLSSTAYDGDLEIVLNGGDLNVTIPNDDFVGPEWSISDNGSRYDRHNENRLVHFSPQNGPEPSTKAAMARLGARFFTAAYLITDNERRTFTMTNTRTAKEQKLVPIEGIDKCSGKKASSFSDNTNTTEPVVSSQTDARTQSRGFSKGAIAGVVVGIAAGIVLVALAVFCIRRRRTKMKASSLSISPPMASSTAYSPPAEIGGYVTKDDEYRKAELPYHHEFTPPQEMPSAKDDYVAHGWHEIDQGIRADRDVLRDIGVLEAPSSPMANGYTNEIARRSF